MDRLEEVLQAVWDCGLTQDQAFRLDVICQELFDKDFCDVSSEDLSGRLSGLNPEGFVLLCSPIIAQIIYKDNWETRLGEQIRDGIIHSLYYEISKSFK